MTKPRQDCDETCINCAEEVEGVTSIPSVRALFIIGEITEQTFAQFAPLFFEMDCTDGDIVIKMCSRGGDVDVGCALYDMITGSRNHVTIHGYGMIASIASFILQAADGRYLAKNCNFMIHQSTVGSPDYPLKQKDLQTQANELGRINEVYVKVLTSRSNLSKKEVAALCAQDSYMTPKQAVALGFADGILR